MAPINALADLGLLNWSTLLLGIKRGWATRQDAIDLAVKCLVDGSESDDVAVVAGGESLNDHQLIALVETLAVDRGSDEDCEKWRLAHLISIAESGQSDEKKLEKLQEIYSEFNYPEDMISCCIYAQDNVDPLVAMAKVIDKLRRQLIPR